MDPQRLPALSRRQAAFLRLMNEAALTVARCALRTSDTFGLWLERHRQRRALNAVSDHLLKDIGLSRADAGRESDKRFWKG